MGLRDLARKLVGGVRALNEEARHPGRPPTHRASGNPFHVEPEERRRPADGPEARPWFLDGSNDGWDDTNPK
jgi:hypothetical protein